MDMLKVFVKMHQDHTEIHKQILEQQHKELELFKTFLPSEVPTSAPVSVPVVSSKKVVAHEETLIEKEFVKIQIQKPCESCKVSGCNLKGYKFSALCGPVVLEQKKAATTQGEVTIQFGASDQEEDQIFRDHKLIGIVAKKSKENKPFLSKVSIFAGQTKQMRIALHPTMTKDPFSTFTYCSYTILDEVVPSSTPTPSLMDLGKMELPY